MRLTRHRSPVARPLILAVLSSLAALACGSEPDDSSERLTVGEHVRQEARFETLEAAFAEVDLLDTLDDAEPLTLFAPTNAAFDALIGEQGLSRAELLSLAGLADLVRYHVHSGAVTPTDLERVTAITTTLGVEVHVRFGSAGLLLNDGVLITDSPIVAENGIIHVLDAVLVRPLVTTTTRIVSDADVALADRNDEDFGVTTDFVTIDEPGFVHDIQLVLDIEHTRAIDLTVYLEHPQSGAFVPLVVRPFTLSNNISTQIADSAVLDSVADASSNDPSDEAFPGVAYRSYEPLEFLLGAPVTGEWQLTIVDSREGETGRLASWQLSMTYGAAPPAEAIAFSRVTSGSGVLPIGFKEPTEVGVRRVGGLVGEVEVRASAGELSAPPVTLADGEERATVEFEVAPSTAVGPRDIEVLAEAGSVSRIRAISAEVVVPDAGSIELLAHVSLPELGAAGFSGNDIWGWTDPVSGIEYALMGTEVGTAFVDLSAPESPVVVGVLPTQTASSAWRDIKVYADHAFIVSEASEHGMQVFDLTQLRGQGAPQTFAADAVNVDFGNAHNVAINEESGFAYVVGATEDAPMICAGGLLMIDIQVPTAPTSVGCFAGGVPTGQLPGPDFPTDAYIHDVQCVTYAGPDPDYQGREICISSDGQITNANNYLAIADVTDKGNPRQVARKSYVGAGYAHQGWLTEDHEYFLLNDEFDEVIEESNTRTYVWDVRDLDAPVVIGTITNPRDAIGHNTYVRGNLAYQANYTSGLRIVDLASIAAGTGTEVAYFDTFPEDDNDDDGTSSARCASPTDRAALPHPDQNEGESCGQQSFSGAWSSYPFFDSGIVVISDMNRGMFVVRPSASLSR